MNEGKPRTESFTLLFADDDPDDRFLIEHAFSAAALPGTLLVVGNGEELLDYLFRRARYAQPGLSPRPSCILLDLNMPRKDGREVLWDIKQHPDFKHLPIVVLTTSDSQADKDYCSELGVSAYVTKPGNFTDLVALMKRIEVLCL